MVFSSSNFLAAVFLAAAPTALAGFDSQSNRNIAVYWGQNSGEVGQERLAYYCNDASIDIINLAFINGITPVSVNFASASNKCTKSLNNTSVLLCREIEEDIKACQKKEKTVLVSMGGGGSTAPNWSSDSDAEASAKLLWSMFGPLASDKVDRPFGTAVVDGFDFDFETPVNHLPAFGGELRRLIDSAADKHKFYLSAVPQCVHPDANVGTTMDAVSFDLVQVQFYNNACGINKFQEDAPDQPAFNLDVWDKWAQTSKNPTVKILLGIPASVEAATSESYTSGSKLKAALDWTKKYHSFGGVMMWDVAQLYANNGFMQEVVGGLSDRNQLPPNQTSPTSVTTSSNSRSSSSPISDIAITQWGQCGGQDYTGSTRCQNPYKCIYHSQWWSDCR